MQSLLSAKSSQQSVTNNRLETIPDYADFNRLIFFYNYPISNHYWMQTISTWFDADLSSLLYVSLPQQADLKSAKCLINIWLITYWRLMQIKQIDINQLSNFKSIINQSYARLIANRLISHQLFIHWVSIGQLPDWWSIEIRWPVDVYLFSWHRSVINMLSIRYQSGIWPIDTRLTIFRPVLIGLKYDKQSISD